MRSFFSSECAALFVGPAPAFRSHEGDGRSFLRQISKIQSVSYGFDINREEIKQLGHEDLLTRRINIISAQPNPGSNIDVNLEPVPVNFEFTYLPTCGLNEYLLNFNVVASGEAAENSFISRHYGDKNFFLVPFYIATIFLLYAISIYIGSTIMIFGIIFIHLFFGFQSNLIREWLLNLRDYKLEMIVTSESQISAYNTYRNNKENEVILNDNSTQNKSGTGSGDEEAILNIF